MKCVVGADSASDVLVGSGFAGISFPATVVVTNFMTMPLVFPESNGLTLGRAQDGGNSTEHEFESLVVMDRCVQSAIQLAQLKKFKEAVSFELVDKKSEAEPEPGVELAAGEDVSTVKKQPAKKPAARRTGTQKAN